MSAEMKSGSDGHSGSRRQAEVFPTVRSMTGLYDLLLSACCDGDVVRDRGCRWTRHHGRAFDRHRTVDRDEVAADSTDRLVQPELSPPASQTAAAYSDASSNISDSFPSTGYHSVAAAGRTTGRGRSSDAAKRFDGPVESRSVRTSRRGLSPDHEGDRSTCPFLRSTGRLRDDAVTQ